MATLTQTLQKNTWLIYAALFLALAVLVIFSPAEATLGNVVKIVYVHGATERVAAYAYLIAAALGIAYLVTKRNALVAWTRAFAETAILFWLLHFLISIPAQVMAWGGITLNEPRVASALWILVMTILVYIVARWIAEPIWMAFAAIANAVIFLIILKGAVNILHPGSAIFSSDSDVMKIFYVGIVMVCGAIAIQVTRDLTARYAAHEE